MKTNQIFIDLDGPILDVSDKYYQLYVGILQKHNFDTLSKQEYWNAKRNKVPESEILEQTNALAIMESYQHQRKLLIETDHYLKYDRIQDGAIEVLDKLSHQSDLILVTLRTFPEKLYKELKYFTLDQYFSAVLTSGADIKPRWELKCNLINSYMKGTKFSESIIIGDTETEILAGKNLGFATIGVLNGIRSYEILNQLQSTYLIDAISDIFSLNIFDNTKKKRNKIICSNLH
jgi:phosphoglycolate phosphatase-like HAD superfamily hydrolase